jgi:formylglycine-generating enzyme required for sulfatase activity
MTMGGAGGTSNEGGTSSGTAGSGSVPEPGASCEGLAADCGPNEDDDCCSISVVPGGTFNRSNDPAFPAKVSSFALDRYEVTVGRFRKFVAAYPDNQPAAGSGKNPHNPADAGWMDSARLAPDKAALMLELNCDDVGQTWTGEAEDLENYAINCVSWYTAFAFCIWDGGRLPTEAEWNLAAAGGSEQRPYPWSSSATDESIDDAHAVYDRSRVSVVGSLSSAGDGRWGHADLAGNVAEWVVDESADYPVPCNDCARLAVGTMDRRHRGGDYSEAAETLLTAERSSLNPLSASSGVGIRCVRDL